MRLDYSLEGETNPGRLTGHRVDCSQVRAIADLGFPVFTLLDCGGPLPADVTRHRCLEESAPASSSLANQVGGRGT